MGVSAVWECRVSTGNQIANEAWTHIAFVWNNVTWAVYVNGVAATLAGTCTSNFASNANDMTLEDNNAVITQWAAFKVWEATLSSAEIASEMQVIRPQRTADLSHWHPFDDGLRALDYSGRGNNPSTVTGTAQRNGPPASWGGE